MDANLKSISCCELYNVFGGIHTCWCYRIPMVPGLSMIDGLSMVRNSQIANLGETQTGKACRKACCDQHGGHEYIYQLGDWNVVAPGAVRGLC